MGIRVAAWLAAMRTSRRLPHSGWQFSLQIRTKLLQSVPDSFCCASVFAAASKFHIVTPHGWRLLTERAARDIRRRAGPE